MYAWDVRAVLLNLVLVSTVWADVPPDPTRPEWQDTPLPMPDIPTLVIALAVTALAVYAMRREARE